MESIDRALGSAIGTLSDENYPESLAFYRFWFGIGQNYHQISPDQIFDALWNNRKSGSIDPAWGTIFHPTAHLILRFARDAELDHVLAPNGCGLQSRLSARSLQDFFSNNLTVVWNRENSRSGGAEGEFYAEANLIAHWANLGYVEEAAIRNHILQSLISHPKLYDHQADALIILFKLAGATFEAYADPLVVDRCFELLNGHNYNPPYLPYEARSCYNNDRIRAKRESLQVRARAGSGR